MPAGVLSARSARNSERVKPKLLTPGTKDAKVTTCRTQEHISTHRSEPLRPSGKNRYPTAGITIQPDDELSKPNGIRFVVCQRRPQRSLELSHGAVSRRRMAMTGKV